MPSLWDQVRRLAARPSASLPVEQQLPTVQRASPRTHLEDAAQVGTALFKWPQNRGLMPANARAFADGNEWVRSAINRLKDKVARAERSMVPVDPNKPVDAVLMKKIADLIENPNPRGDSWRSFVEPVIEDLLTLGKGGWEYVPNWRGWPVALFPFNAEFMVVNDRWDGSFAGEARYFWIPVPRQAIPLKNEEVTLMLLNPSTHRTEGLSCIETLKQSIEADEAGNEFVRTMLKKYPPPGWLNLGPTAGPRQVRAVSEKLQTDVLGSGGMLVTAGMEGTEFKSLWSGTSRDNELMAWSHYFAYKICAVFGVSPQDLGLTFDVNRATASEQSDITRESGYKSLLMMVEEYINREIVAKFGLPESINMRFTFKELTSKDKMKQVDLVTKVMNGVPVMTINEARMELDLLPVENGDALFSVQPAVALLGEDAQAYNQIHADRLGNEAEAVAQPPPDDPTDTTDEKPAAKKKK